MNAGHFTDDELRTGRRVIVLPLPFWADMQTPAWKGTDWAHTVFLECVGAPRPAIFNRYGMYLHRLSRQCWVESPHGCHDYKRGYECGRYELALDLHRPLRDDTRAALKLLAKERLLDTGGRRLLSADTDWKDRHRSELDISRVKVLPRKFKHERGIV